MHKAKCKGQMKLLKKMYDGGEDLDMSPVEIMKMVKGGSKSRKKKINNKYKMGGWTHSED